MAAPAASVFAIALLVATSRADPALPERVTFPSADGRTTLIGYVYASAATGKERAPAVVMMHGRAGAYSSLARGRYDASTLSQRHQMWGLLWVQHGYIVVLVDGYGRCEY